MDLHDTVEAQLKDVLALDGTAQQRLNLALRILSKWRSTLIHTVVVQKQGTTVSGGPFEGMRFLANSQEGCHTPKLLGTYEEELHRVVTAAAKYGYDDIINIGCAEGYYAVGLKRMSPATRVHAYDTDPGSRTACQKVADSNGVSLEIGETFTPDMFAAFAGRRVLVWCDIEGAELALLDPTLAPALVGFDLVVELHRTDAGHTRDILPARFAPTHDIEIIESTVQTVLIPPALQNANHLDQILSRWEWRSAPTPWAVMRSKAAKR